jgi:hypothetical protein
MQLVMPAAIAGVVREPPVDLVRVTLSSMRFDLRG